MIATMLLIILLHGFSANPVIKLYAQKNKNLHLMLRSILKLVQSLDNDQT